MNEEEQNDDIELKVRDVFAAMAMMGWLASYGPDNQHPANVGGCELIAKQSYAMADAMLAAREL